MKELTVYSAVETMAIGQKLSALVEPGDVILLIGDLGAGKTTFTKGFATGLGINDRVKSPTFNLIREYQTGRLPLYHMDFYRLEGIGGSDLGLEEYFDGDGVSVIEWPTFIQAELPTQYLNVELIRTGINDDDRKIQITANGDRYETLLESLVAGLSND